MLLSKDQFSISSDTNVVSPDEYLIIYPPGGSSSTPFGRVGSDFAHKFQFQNPLSSPGHFEEVREEDTGTKVPLSSIVVRSLLMGGIADRGKMSVKLT